VRVDEARQDDLIARVDRLGGVEARRDRLRTIDGDDGGAVDGDGAGRQHLMRRVLGDDRAGDDDEGGGLARRLACSSSGDRQRRGRNLCTHVRKLYSLLAVPVHLVDHPLVHDALLSLRDKRTPPDHFRRAATRISVLLAAEATRDLPSKDASVETPIGPAPGRRIGPDVVVVPVLRAGLGMLDAVLELIPSARVGHIGLQRDELTAGRIAVLFEAALGFSTRATC